MVSIQTRSLENMKPLTSWLRSSVRGSSRVTPVTQNSHFYELESKSSLNDSRTKNKWSQEQLFCHSCKKPFMSNLGLIMADSMIHQHQFLLRYVDLK